MGYTLKQFERSFWEMKKIFRIIIPVFLIGIVVYAYSVMPVAAIEQNQPDPSSNTLFNTKAKKKSSDSDDEAAPPPLTGMSRSQSQGSMSSANWPWPGYSKDGYKLQYDDEQPKEVQLECTPAIKKELEGVNKKIEGFFEVGMELKEAGVDIRNKSGLRKIVNKVKENEDALIAMELHKYTELYKACKMSMPSSGPYPLNNFINQDH